MTGQSIRGRSTPVRAWLSAAAVAALWLTPALAWAQDYVTLNPTGGTSVEGGDGLKVYAGALLTLQVNRKGSGQLYYSGSLPDSNNPSFRQAVAVGPVTYGSGLNQPLSADSQTLTGTGTAVDPYVAVTKVSAGTTGVSLRQEFRYIHPSDVLSVVVDVTPPSNNTLPIKLYMGGDTYLDGGDRGPAYREPIFETAADDPPSVLGVAKNGQFMVFIAGNRPFSNWYSAHYGNIVALMSLGGDLDNSTVADPNTDNGIAVEWSLGAITAPVRITYSLAFTTVASTCGNGLVEGFETCDDKNKDSSDGCSPSCQVEVGYACTGSPSQCIIPCGDGIIAGKERCDDGNLTQNDGCAKDCTIETGWLCTGAPSQCLATCGDGRIVGKEACDDGSTAEGDGCSKLCTVEEGWLCTGAPSKCKGLDGHPCSAKTQCVSNVCDLRGSHTCEPANTCGNGSTDSGETCDDGGVIPNDGCSATCQMEIGQACTTTAQCGAKVCDLKGSFTCEAANTCGNGTVDSGEACDDGSTTPGDGCDANCQGELGGKCSANSNCPDAVCDLLGSGTCEPAHACGNGALEAGEICDDGNADNGDGCSNLCKREPGKPCTSNLDCAGVCDLLGSNKCEPASTCGNGTLEAGEICDDGNAVSGDGCSGLCRKETGKPCTVNGDCSSGLCETLGSSTVCGYAVVCGNSVLETGEICDDGNNSETDGCTSDCLRGANQVCSANGECHSGICDSTGSSPQCEPADTCGNGIIEGDEACDDGGNAPGDGCTASCQLENGTLCVSAAQCASGVCDLRQSQRCEAAGRCGNGFLDPGEGCDDGSTQPGDGCNGDCLVETKGGCSTPADCASGLCALTQGRPQCLPAGVCGNGAIEAGEGCDDGNTTDNDGCSAVCLKENGGACLTDGNCKSGVCDATSTRTCEAAASCGNGRRDPGEACDDGATVPGDGCSALCLTELGKACTTNGDCQSGSCTGTPHTCVASAQCGNDLLEPDEACDDGNRTPGDGCSADCTVEAPKTSASDGYAAGGGIGCSAAGGTRGSFGSLGYFLALGLGVAARRRAQRRASRHP